MSNTLDPKIKTYHESACYAVRMSTSNSSFPNLSSINTASGLGRQITACMNCLVLLSALMATVAMLVCSVWLSFDLLTSFPKEVDSLSPAQLLHALAGA